MNQHFMSLVLGLAQQAEGALAGKLPPGAEGLSAADARQVGQGALFGFVEVEDVLYRHAAVLSVAVVAAPDPKWGEVPCAFVELKEGAQATEAEIVDFCRERMARFKVPKKVVFGPLPKTSTGKIQKFVLREKAKSTQAID